MVKLGKPERIFLCLLKEGLETEEIKKAILHFSYSDWQELYDIAQENDLLPIFYSRLISLDFENIPEELLSRVKSYYFHNLKRNLVLEQRILEVIRHLKNNHIPAVPLKGPIFARLLYGDLALRRASCDLDLLVPRSLLGEAEKKLKDLGYSFHHDYLKPDFFHRFRKQINLLRCKEKLDGITLDLDLHWDFRTGFIATTIDDFWLNIKEVNIDGYQILTFSTEDLLLFLALTAVTDWEFVQIKYIYDIHRLIIKFGQVIDWDKLIYKAKHFHLDTALFFSLKLAKDLFNAKLPDEFLSILKPAFIKRTLLKIWINEVNVLKYRKRIAASYLWWVFLGNYIYAKNITSCMKIVLRRIFLPLEQVMNLYNQSAPGKGYVIYIRRLLSHTSHFMDLRKW